MIPSVSHKLRIVWIIIPACLIEQPNRTLIRMYVQMYMRVKQVAVSVHSKARNEYNLQCTSKILWISVIGKLRCNKSAVMIWNNIIFFI